MPLMINFRFFLALGLPITEGTVPKFDILAVDTLRERGIRTALGLSLSCAITFVESGGSFICEASVGSDHSDGVEVEKMAGEWARTEPRFSLRVTLGASIDVLVCDVADECVIVDEVLGRGCDTSLLPSEGN